jgi:hypothetical protein
VLNPAPPYLDPAGQVGYRAAFTTSTVGRTGGGGGTSALQEAAEVLFDSRTRKNLSFKLIDLGREFTGLLIDHLVVAGN